MIQAGNAETCIQFLPTPLTFCIFSDKVCAVVFPYGKKDINPLCLFLKRSLRYMVIKRQISAET